MNAMTLYLHTCRQAMCLRPDEPESWGDLCRLLPHLRQALSCCICTKILHIPHGPLDSACQHHVCQDCIGGKMRLRPSCSWCKNFDEFQENAQLRILVMCFKELCVYLSKSPILTQLGTTDNGGNFSLLTVIQDGCAIVDNYQHTSSSSNSTAAFLKKLPKLQNVPSAVTTTKVIKQEPRSPGRSPRHHSSAETSEMAATKNKTESSTHVHRSKNSNDSQINGGFADSNSQNELKERMSQTVAQEHDYIKDSSCLVASVSEEESLTLKIRRVENDNHAGETSDWLQSNSDSDTKLNKSTDSFPSPMAKKKKVRASNNKSKLKIGCRCGMATPSPGKLTCCGQRCPCYSKFIGCVPECKCRGCRNPREVPKDKLKDGDDTSDSNDSDVEIDV